MEKNNHANVFNERAVMEEKLTKPHPKSKADLKLQLPAWDWDIGQEESCRKALWADSLTNKQVNGLEKG